MGREVSFTICLFKDLLEQITKETIAHVISGTQ